MANWRWTKRVSWVTKRTFQDAQIFNSQIKRLGTTLTPTVYFLRKKLRRWISKKLPEAYFLVFPRREKQLFSKSNFDYRVGNWGIWKPNQAVRSVLRNPKVYADPGWYLILHSKVFESYFKFCAPESLESMEFQSFSKYKFLS